MMLTRRDILRGSLLAVMPLVQQQERPSGSSESTGVPAARLADPSLAGRPRGPVTDYENDPFIIGVEEKLRCTCGCNLDVYTCRTTDFTCQTSPAMHRQVISLVEENRSAQEILDAFIAEYGEMVLMAPRKEGFNIVGYVLPGMAISLIGGSMLWVLSRRTKARAIALKEAATEAGVPGLSTEDDARLEAELAGLG